MNTNKLQLTRVFNAPRELVFQAWTDAHQFKHWFGAAACEGASLESVKVDARTGGKYRLQVRRADGEYYTTAGIYREVTAPERLVFTWAFEKDGSGDEYGEIEPPEMLVTVEFNAQGTQTELTLTHERFASVESRDRHADGWNRCLDSLANFTTTKPVSTPAEPNHLVGKEFVITREYDAPRELVWLACTDARHVAQWWGPRGFSAPVCEWDAQPGNKLYVIMRAPDGTDFPMGGQFHEVVAPERLVTTAGALDAHGNLLFEFHHTLTLLEQDGKTKLTMRSRLLQVIAPDAAKYIGGFEAGMTQTLERLTDVVGRIPFAMERVLDAPVALVWRALTTPADLGRWYFDLVNFRPEAGCEFSFVVEHEGHTYDHRCQVTTVIPQKLIAYTWRYHGHEGTSRVTFELFAEGGKTKLKLTHEGLETFPPAPHFARKNFVRGWNWLIGSALPDFVENCPREIFIARDFNAPRELVWEAMTKPQHVVNWWGPRGFSMTIEQMDFRVGGDWKHVLHGPDGVNYPNHSVFQEIVQPERIVFSNGGRCEGGPGVSFVSTWSFARLAADRTRVSIRMVFPSAAERDRVAKEFGAIEGAQQTLARLEEYLPKVN